MPDNRYNRFAHITKPSDPSGDVPAPTVRALLRAVDDAEVLYLAFPRLDRALVIDPRPGYPAALVAALAFGASVRRAVETLRPGQPPSERAIAVTWGGSTRAFVEQGVLAAILAKLPTAAEPSVRAAFAQLQEAERGPAPAQPGTEAPSGQPSDY